VGLIANGQVGYSESLQVHGERPHPDTQSDP
jgi:hypothetical protein